MNPDQTQGMNAAPTTLRLVFPQWQGGGLAPYHLGAQLLDWLAPAPSGPVAYVPVVAPDGAPLPLEGGIRARTALLAQQRDAMALIAHHDPARLVVLGGDCLVDLAPFAWLNRRYKGRLAILWIDTHPDIMTAEHFENAHAMVLGNLIGQGDPAFRELVERPISPRNVFLAGLHDPSPVEAALIARYGLRHAGPQMLAHDSAPVLDWLAETGATHLAIHFDLDVLSPEALHALYFNNPQAPSGAFDSIAQGQMSLSAVMRLIADVARAVDIVGLGITECLPWDAMTLRDMLSRLPLLGPR